MVIDLVLRCARGFKTTLWLLNRATVVVEQNFCHKTESRIEVVAIRHETRIHPRISETSILVRYQTNGGAAKENRCRAQPKVYTLPCSVTALIDLTKKGTGAFADAGAANCISHRPCFASWHSCIRGRGAGACRC